MGRNELDGLKLGQQQLYVDQYDAELLQSIARGPARQSLEYDASLGVDIWTAYELSWLSVSGMPRVAIAEFFVPASSPNIIESKSLKYYLNSFNQTQFANAEALSAVIESDLSAVAGQRVACKLYSLDVFARNRLAASFSAQCLDDLAVEIDCFEPNKSILKIIPESGEALSCESIWCSHLLKSNCPVTGQPDWASIWIGIEGVSLCPESLLRYIVSYRKHQGFHENCVESIYCDLMGVCEPSDLWVYARYTRRGGLDINPFRSLNPIDVPKLVGARQ